MDITNIGIPALFALIVLDKFGLLDRILPKKDVDGEWKGEITTTLAYMKDDMHQIKEDNTAMRVRLGEHLKDEEEKMDIVDTRLGRIEAKIHIQ